MNLRFVGAAVLTIGLLVLSGCGGADGRLPTVPVTGTVSVGGVPVKGATITFHPVKEEGARKAFAMTNDLGEFSLTTYDDGDGAVAGEYKISIEQVTMKEGIDVQKMTPSGPENPGGGDMYAKMMTGNKKEMPFEDSGTVPGKFQDPDKSGLKRTVEASGGNVFNFTLEIKGL